MEQQHITNSSEKVLHQTIAHIESRLAIMGDNGDCAYERALANSYHELLVQYGRRLFLLQSRRYLLSKPSAFIAQGKAN